MKYLKFILALYLLSLSLLPCSDDACGDEEISIELTQTNHESGEDNHQDNCTPLCSCSCCGISIAFLSSETPIPPNTIFSRFTSQQYQESGFSSFNFSFWQPPKISQS